MESGDDENEDNEPDTRFDRPLVRLGPLGAAASGTTSGAPTRGASLGSSSAGDGGGGGGSLLDLPNAQDIVRDLVDALRALEMDVQLLGGQKYMINSCLGIKVSAGGFRMRLADTEAYFEDSGYLVITTGIDHISLSAIKLRMRPNLRNPLELCKFSKKFEVGGDLDDVRLTLRCDPILSVRMQVVGINSSEATVRIGNLNLKPLQNNLDSMAKDMVEDGLNVFLHVNFLEQVIDVLKKQPPPPQWIGDRLVGSGGSSRGGGSVGNEAGSDSSALGVRMAEFEARLTVPARFPISENSEDAPASDTRLTMSRQMSRLGVVVHLG